MATNASTRTSAATVAAPLAVTSAHDRVLFGFLALPLLAAAGAAATFRQLRRLFR